MDKFYLFSGGVSQAFNVSKTLMISILLIAFGKGVYGVPLIVNVGIGQTYTSLTNTGGLFSALKTGAFNGASVATIISDINETGAVSFTATLFKGSLTIQSNGTMHTLSGSSVDYTKALININGADSVTIDGGVGKMLIFQYLGTNSGPVIQFTSGSSPSVIRNCTLQSNSISTHVGVIKIGSGDNSVTIDDCNIQDIPGIGSPYRGIYSDNTGNSTNNILTITNNNIYNWKNYGIYLMNLGKKCIISGNSFFMQNTIVSYTAQTAVYSYSNSHTITGNFIGGQAPNCGGGVWKNAGTGTVDNSGNITITGILLDRSSSSSTIQGNTIQNITLSKENGTCSFYGIYNNIGLVNVRKNRIFNIGATSSSAIIYGINNNNTGITGVSEFSNNIISIGGGSCAITGFSENSSYSTSSTVCYYNSINIYGVSEANSSYAYSHSAKATAPVTLKDNIFSNVRTGGTGTHYAIYSTPTTGFTSDYNDLYVSGTVLGSWAGNDKADLTAWKAATTMDSHSVSIKPEFANDIDLHISSNPGIAAKGITITVPAITDDIDGVLRNGTPDLGAYQFSSSNNWNGTISTDWNEAGNWTNGVPLSTSTANIFPASVTNFPHVTLAMSTPVVCNNLNIIKGASLTIDAGQALTVAGILTNNNNAGTVGIIIQSDSKGTGSLITNTALGTGWVEAQRWMAAGKWNIVSSPLSGQSVSNFLTSNPTIATTTSGATQRGMMDYDAKTDIWNFTDQSSGNLEAGKGFSMRIAGTNAAAVTFSGSLQIGNLSPSKFIPGYWNCVGNPYTSAIAMNAKSTSGSNLNFLTENINNLDLSNGAIYVWELPDINNETGKYNTYSNASDAFNIQQGQAFMIKMNASSTIINFKPGMQFHAPSLSLKSVQTPWPTIKLKTAVGTRNSSTIIAFNSAMTKGLDPTYDAGLLKGGSDLLVYSRLLEDNGIPFAIQALPDNDYNNMIIPIGLDFKTGGEVIFSSELLNLPSDLKVILEDMLAKTYTDLSKDVYKTTIAANSVITDRFRLKITSTNTGLDIETASGKLTAYAIRNIEIHVKGRVSKNAIATLYDVHGRVILVKNLKDGSVNIIPLPNIKIGIYMLSLIDNGKLTGFKILIKE